MFLLLFLPSLVHLLLRLDRSFVFLTLRLRGDLGAPNDAHTAIFASTGSFLAAKDVESPLMARKMVWEIGKKL